MDPERLSPQDLSFLEGLREGVDYGLIPLTQGQVAVVDMCDWWELVVENWCALWHVHTQSFYVVRGKRKSDGGWERNSCIAG